MKLTDKEQEQIRNFYWLTGISDLDLAKLYGIHEKEVAAVLKNMENGN